MKGLRSSGSAHSADAAAGAQLKAKAEALRDVCSEAAACADEGTEKLASILFSPVHSYIDMTEDGIQFTGPVDVHASEQWLEDNLKLILSARAEAGETRACNSLSPKQFEKAKEWMQYSCFEQRFMHDEHLKEQIYVYTTFPETLSRKEKSNICKARNAADKAWRKTVLGNKDLTYTIMQHGFFQMDEVQDFMDIFLNEATKGSEDSMA